MRKSNSINYVLYETRLSFHFERKTAANLLGISKLHLYLIEKGYIDVSEKLKPLFIALYKLKDDFFETHTNYITPIDYDEVDIKQRIKIRKVICKKRFKVIAYLSLAISLGLVAFGIYGINRRFVTPRIAWSERYSTFYETMKVRGKREASAIDLDYIYYVEKKSGDEDPEYDFTTRIITYEKETNAINTNIDVTYQTYEQVTPTTYTLDDTYNFVFFSVNKKKIILTSYYNKDKSVVINGAIAVLNEVDGNYSIYLRPFNYIADGKSYRAKTNSDEYNIYLASLSIILPVAFSEVDQVFEIHGLPYTKSSQLLEDLHVIARDASFYNRMGLSFIVIFSFVACAAIVLGALSYYATYKLKPHVEIEEFPSPIISRDIPVRKIYKDINYHSIIPEFMMRTIGLIFLAFSSSALFIAVYAFFNADFATYIDVNRIRSLTSNFLVSAILLLFFIKLDVYARKDSQSLLVNIIGLFIGGLMFYIVEILVYRAVVVEGNIFSKLLEELANIFPGNIFWNIMLYSLIFYFLFTVPKKYEDKPAKVLKWRLFSLIPTFILFFALFYKLYLEKMIESAFYVSFLFHTSGVITTLFAIFYIYSLYFLRLHNKLTFGEINEYVYSYSRRFSLEKNILASIIILLLFGIDMFFRFKFPNNDFKLGKNWTIVLLIPFILLYRPHVGKRNARWDSIYTSLYGVTFAGGYIAAGIYILINLNIADALFILF